MTQELSKIGLIIMSILIANITFIADSARDQFDSVGPQRKTRSRSVTNTTTPTPSVVPLSVGIRNPQSQSQTFTYSEPVPTIPWGTTEKIGEHTYRTYIGEDPVMSTVEELHAALNKYRRNHGVRELIVSDGLCMVADFRISQLEKIGGLDAHKGFIEYLDVQSNWDKLPRFVSLGENNSYGYKQTGTHIVEWVFDADEEHKSNQLNPMWNRVCSRISGTIVEMIFGEER